MLFRTLIISLLLTLSALPAFGVAKSRPLSGTGLLVIRPFPPQRDDVSTLAIYREPGVERIAELDGKDLPPLAPVIQGRNAEYPVAVIGKKGNWLRVAYDDAGREGWLEMPRYWEYSPWGSFLKGRAARLLPGLKKDLYLLRREPSPTSQKIDTLSRQKNLRIIEIKEDWALVLVDLTSYGWMRWRDNDGRFAISIDDKFDPQKH